MFPHTICFEFDRPDCGAWWGSGSLTFELSADVLPELPTHVGLAWTDGAGTVSFEAWGPGGAYLGRSGPHSAIPDDNFLGGVAEDRFFGVIADGGISRVRISNSSGGIEADHIKPLGEPHNGPDTPDNILCLCPNCHVLFDRGAIAVADDLSLIGIDGDLKQLDDHTISSEYLKYHRDHYGS